MMKIKLISLSKEIPNTFKLVNWIILLPILFWPLVFYVTIFFFDDPNANLKLVWTLFWGVNLYPLYLILLFELNARLYKKSSLAGYILPLLFVGSLFYLFMREYNSDKKLKKERILENQKRKEAGYIGNCSTYKIINNVVFYKDTVLDADPLSFKYLSCHYGKDKNLAFKGKERIEGSHSDSFEIIDWQWQKDKNRYYFQGQALENIDYQTFKILDLSYSKDKNSVYYKAAVLEEAEPETFRINRMNGIGSDGKNKFEHGKKITTTNSMF
jgi:hypothetical protein